MASPAPNAHQSPDEEEPLDPRLEAVAQKMRRLSMVSSAIMFLGVFVVLGVILYRSLSGPSSAQYPENLTADEVRALVIETIPGAAITSVTVDGQSVFVGVTGDDGPALLEVDRPLVRCMRSASRFAASSIRP